MPSRRVLVTGASRGIGAAIATAFAAQGDRVAVHYSHSREHAEEVLTSLPGDGHLLVAADMRSASDIAAMIEEVEKAWGGIDVLVNNAGVVHRVPVDCDNPDEWQSAWTDSFEVNLLGPALVSWHALRVMGHGGRIINITSRAAFRGMPDSIPYAASKAGLAAMTQSLALAVAERGIAVTAIAPGYVDTDMGRLALDGPMGESIRKQSPFGRVAVPEEVAAAVIYLASPAAEWAAGTIIDLNGASHLRM